MGDPGSQSLGRYQILKHLATGGLADVLLARATGPHGVGYHVVKRARPDQAADAAFLRVFLDEARLAVMLRHPNIVHVHEVGEADGQFFIAMEYVHGRDLRAVLAALHEANDHIPLALVTSIVAAAAEGLHHAHTLTGPHGEPLGIVHRDVSPSNILVGYDGGVRVTDFEIAKSALRAVETGAGTRRGKVSYLSPEQITGKAIDRRSDVFALGVVLYELATTRRLFKGETDFLTMRAIAQAEIPPPSQHRPELPRALEDIILKALAADPGDRFQSAQELRDALDELTRSLDPRMSQAGIADYMKKLFGVRLPPWLAAAAADGAPPAVLSPDFDGSAAGIVAPPEAAQAAQAAQAAIEPAPARVEAVDAARGSTTPLAWPSQADRPSSARRIGKAIAAIAAAGAAAVAAFAIVSRIGTRELRAAEPPAPPPATPELVPPAPPDAAPPDAPPRGSP